MTPTQLSNLRDLRALGRRILAEPDRYPLVFGDVECDTFACWAGHYKRANPDTLVVRARIPSIGGYYYDAETASAEFGVTEQQANLLFDSSWCLSVVHRQDGIDMASDFPGAAAYTELERRLTYLDTLITEHEPKGMPDSVRRIFDGETVQA